VRTAVREGVLGGLPYLRLGRGPDLVVLNGITPVATPPRPVRRAAAITFAPLARRSTVWLVNRRPGLHPAVTMADLAADHAAVLTAHFGGPVDVLGVSTGGSVALQLAADHPRAVQRLVVACAAHRLGPLAKEVMLRAAALQRAGADRAAQRELARLTTRSAVSGRVLGDVQWLAERLLFGRHVDRADWYATIRAEDVFDLGPRLREITAPTLVVGGDRDLAYPPELLAATASGIPGATLRLYRGRGHGGALVDRRFAPDVARHLRGG